MQWAGYLAAILPTFFWGTSFVAIKLLLREVSPFTALVPRFGLGSVGFFLVLALIYRGLPPVPSHQLGRLFFVALAGSGLNSFAVAFAVNYLGAGISSLVIMLVPVLTGLLAVLSGQETLSARKVQGFLVAFVGLSIVVLFGGPGASFAGTKLIGLVLMVLAALGFAIYNVHVKPLYVDYSPLQISGYVGIVSSLGLLPFLLYPPVFAEVAALSDLSVGGWLAAGYLAVFSNVLGYILWYWALGRLESTRVALFTYLIPIWGVATAALLLQERVTWWLPFGVALVVVGIVITNRPIGARQTRTETEVVARPHPATDAGAE